MKRLTQNNLRPQVTPCEVRERTSAFPHLGRERRQFTQTPAIHLSSGLLEPPPPPPRTAICDPQSAGTGLWVQKAKPANPLQHERFHEKLIHWVLVIKSEAPVWLVVRKLCQSPKSAPTDQRHIRCKGLIHPSPLGLSLVASVPPGTAYRRLLQLKPLSVRRCRWIDCR